MKAWSKVHIKDKNKDVELISKALMNYLFQYGPIHSVYHKYNISSKEKMAINQYTANRIAGLLLLYLSKDYQRINDILNKYNLQNNNLSEIIPEIEGYIER